MKNKVITVSEATARLEALCAVSEQCSYEVTQKMLRWGIAAADRYRVLDSLVERRFVDDARYASAYARSKFRFSRWGRRKIRVGLMAKRIPRHLIDGAVAEAAPDDEYVATLRKLLLAKARSVEEPLSRDGVAKLCRFAMQRGFEWEYISKVIDELRNGAVDEEDW